MEPQKPAPEGKQYAVARHDVTFQYCDTLEDATAAFLAEGMNATFADGIRLELWVLQHNRWLLADQTEQAPLPQS